MMRFLFIDTSTERGLIACGNGNEIVFSHELPFGSLQSKYLMSLLSEKLQGLDNHLFDAVGVGIGPGSYTGMRIGAAVAQALAYSWKIPLVAIPSLEGFVSSVLSVRYAAVLDARIGGVYFQMGQTSSEGIIYENFSQLASMEEIGFILEKISHLVTPFAKSLKAKLKVHYPNLEWTWEEKAPEARYFLKSLENRYLEGKIIIPPEHLELLYLRETEAEREKKKNNPHQ